MVVRYGCWLPVHLCAECPDDEHHDERDVMSMLKPATGAGPHSRRQDQPREGAGQVHWT